jgi:XTP/dITP diphosphohydrolase
VKLLAATRSAGKQVEFRRVLEPAGIKTVFPDDVGLYPTVAEGALELGDTFEANARRKAEHFARLSGLPTVADDSGLEVLALGGAPGVRSRRWAGATGTDAQVDAANNAELVRRLAGATGVRRAARYRCVLVYLARPGAVPVTFEGACAGRILEEPRGDGGFGYDPYFFSDELGKTFAEAAPEEKDRVSHRGRALRALADALEPARGPGDAADSGRGGSR